MTFSKQRGFTILELLVVIAAVGILAAVAIYSLNLTRAASRDSKRVSDVSVMRAALTQFWLQKATFPTSDAVDLGRTGANVDVLSGNGWSARDQAADPIILEQAPLGPKAGEYYRYHGSSNGYALRFVTERDTAYGPAGTWYAHADGVDQVDEEK